MVRCRDCDNVQFYDDDCYFIDFLDTEEENELKEWIKKHVGYCDIIDSLVKLDEERECEHYFPRGGRKGEGDLN